MAGEGMVAVVQGLRDCGLAVALLDEDGKTYTLVPRAVERKTAATAALPKQCDAGAQATDGRYATVYKVHHCKMTPTSPPTHLTEFPPQRAEVSPGHDNFEVGGAGSGETYIPVKSSSYRGGMCWTDRGSVCSPRPSRDPDAFASSLRRYPVSPDHSAEMVERLITYSHHNNYNRFPRHCSPPCRTCDHSSSHCSARSSRQGTYEPEPSVTRRQRSPEEYPTRDRRCYDAELCRKSTFCKNSDVRVVRDISKRLRDSIKCMSSYTVAPHASTDTRDRSEAPALELCHSNVADIEIQAAASMVSRKVCTVAQPVPIRRTVAIPLSPASSHSGPDQTVPLPIDPLITKSVQTIDKPLLIKSVQTTTSLTEIPMKKAKVTTRKSKSFSDFAVDKELKEEILEFLDDDSDPKLKSLQDAVLKKLRCRLNKTLGMNLDKLKIKCDCEKCQDILLKEYITTELHRTNDYCWYVCKSADMLGTGKAESFIDTVNNDQNNFDSAIKEWINDISKKKNDILRPVIKEHVYNTFVKRLKHSAIKKLAYHREQSLRAEILDLLDEVPIDYHGLNKRVYLNTLVDALITKLENISEKQTNSKHHGYEYLDESIAQTSRECSKATEKAKQLSAIEINATKTKTKPYYTRGKDIKLSDILMHSINRENSYNDIFASDDVSVLLNNITKLPKNEAAESAMQLTENLKEKFNDKDTVAENRPKTVLLLQNMSKINTTHTNKTGKSIPRVADGVEDAESIKYMNQLADKIEEWLSNLKVNQVHDKEFRRAAVNDLANDIIDRQKYLEMSNNRGSDIDELEHLKYQIFKWINKLVGEDNTETIDRAAELMLRIKNIPFPIPSTPLEHEGIPESDVSRLCCQGAVICSKCNSYTNTPTAKSRSGIGNWNISKQKQIPTEWRPQTVFTASTNNQSICSNSNNELNNNQKAGSGGFWSRNPKDSRSSLLASSQSNSLGNSSKPKPMSSLRPPCCPGPPPGTPSIKQLNEEFDAYVTNWVKEIPIPSSTPEEAAIAEKARLGIHNGIWKAITRMKFEPSTFHNKFLYEDVLEEEIDELLNLLPQTPELQDKRHLLKVKLIEKTGETNDMIWTAASPASYKQQLAQQVASNLPRRTVDTDDEDPNKLFEEMLILCIADDFILSTRYKDEDKVKANAYRNKVIRKIEAIIDEVKRTYGKEIQGLNSELCVNDVVSALHKVPLPTEETIRQEADEILLGLEIEQWFNDLPIVKNDDRTEQLHRRRLRDALAKKLHDLEKEVNIADCSGEPQFKHEISMFLEKVPLEKDESLNINFMVDELTNRMKNREKATNRRKSVVFQDGQTEYKEPQGWPDEPNSRLQSGPRRQDASSQGEFGNQYNISCSDSMNPGHQYESFSKDIPACSSMINPQTGHQESYKSQLPEYRQWGVDSKPNEKWYSFDTIGNLKESSERSGPYLAYEPGKFYEENLGGKFGCTLHGQMPMSSQRYAYPEPVDSSNPMGQGPMMEKFFDSQGNLKPSTSPGVCQYQPISALPDQSDGMQHSYGRAPQHMDSALGCLMHSGQGSAMPQTCPGMPQNVNQVPAYDRQMDMSSFRRFSSERPPSSSRKETSGEFISLLHDSKGPPQSYTIQPRTAPPSPLRTFHDPYMQPFEQTLGGRFGGNSAQASHPCQNCSQRADNAPRPDQVTGRPRQQSLVMGQIQQGQPSLHTSQVRNNATNVSQVADRSIHATGIPPDCNNRTLSHELPQIIDCNRNANTPFHRTEQDRSGYPQPVPQEPQNRSMPQATPFQGTNQDRSVFSQPQEPQNTSIPQTCPHVNISNSNRDASPSYYDQDPRFLAPNQPLTGMSISNQPVGFSTPNQRMSNAHPPNVKVKRQIERDRNSRRVDSGTDDGEEVRVRCQCIERLNRRCKKRRGPFFGCDECMEGFPFYFPMGCSYPYFFNGR